MRSCLTCNICIPSVSLLVSACMHVRATTCQPQVANMAGYASIGVQMHSTMLALRQCTTLKLLTMLTYCLACQFGQDQAADKINKHYLTHTKELQGHSRHICLLKASCRSAAISLKCSSQACGGHDWSAWMHNTATWCVNHAGRGQHSRTDIAGPAAGGDSQRLQPHEAGLGPSGLGSVHPEPPAPPADSAGGCPSSLICP